MFLNEVDTIRNSHFKRKDVTRTISVRVIAIIRTRRTKRAADSENNKCNLTRVPIIPTKPSNSVQTREECEGSLLSSIIMEFDACCTEFLRLWSANSWLRWWICWVFLSGLSGQRNDTKKKSKVITSNGDSFFFIYKFWVATKRNIFVVTNINFSRRWEMEGGAAQKTSLVISWLSEFGGNRKGVTL